MRLAFCGAVWAGIDDVNVHTVVLGLKTAPQGGFGWRLLPQIDALTERIAKTRQKTPSPGGGGAPGAASGGGKGAVKGRRGAAGEILRYCGRWMGLGDACAGEMAYNQGQFIYERVGVGATGTAGVAAVRAPAGVGAAAWRCPAQTER